MATRARCFSQTTGILKVGSGTAQRWSLIRESQHYVCQILPSMAGYRRTRPISVYLSSSCKLLSPFIRSKTPQASLAGSNLREGSFPLTSVISNALEIQMSAPPSTDPTAAAPKVRPVNSSPTQAPEMWDAAEKVKHAMEK